MILNVNRHRTSLDRPISMFVGTSQCIASAAAPDCVQMTMIQDLYILLGQIVGYKRCRCVHGIDVRHLRGRMTDNPKSTLKSSLRASCFRVHSASCGLICPHDADRRTIIVADLYLSSTATRGRDHRDPTSWSIWLDPSFSVASGRLRLLFLLVDVGYSLTDASPAAVTRRP
jgi:hypothetical protein